MNNVNLIKALVLSSFILPLSLNADPASTKESLDIQCQALARTVTRLVLSQERTTCIEKLTVAADLIEKAGHLILDYAYVSAKNELTHAIYSLQYAELSSCKQYIQISHSKYMAQKIKNALQS